MELFACLPKAEGFGHGNEISHVSEFHGLIAPAYQSDRKKLPHRITMRTHLTICSAHEGAETQVRLLFQNLEKQKKGDWS